MTTTKTQNSFSFLSFSIATMNISAYTVAGTLFSPSISYIFFYKMYILKIFKAFSLYRLTGNHSYMPKGSLFFRSAIRVFFENLPFLCFSFHAFRPEEPSPISLLV